LSAAFGLILTAVPLSAQHAFSAEFDRAKPVSVKGTVPKVEWTNQHARLYVDVKDENGQVVSWDFELSSPNGLMRRGWTRNSLKPGEEVTVTGFGAKNAPHLANATAIVMSNAREMFAGSSADEQ
jgi:outer membrane usher protein FimD/PapC